MTDKTCMYYMDFGYCSFYDNPDGLGNCLYEKGIETNKVQEKCEFYEETLPGKNEIDGI